MAVHVWVPGKAESRKHPEGTDYDVGPLGHLLVTKPGRGGFTRSVAVYAPDAWRHAEIVENQQS